MNIFKTLSTKNKILIIATLTILLIAVPLTIMQSLKQQNMKQRASNDSLGFSVMLTPSSLIKNINEDMDVDIHLLNSQQKEISAVDINYGGINASMFESVSFQPSTVGTFTNIINSNGRYVGIIHQKGNVSYADIGLGTLKFIKSKEAGNVNLNFNIRINVPGIHDAIVLENIGGQYTITDIKQSSLVSPTVGSVYSSPTSIPTVAPIPALIPTATSIPAPTPAESIPEVFIPTASRTYFLQGSSCKTKNDCINPPDSCQKVECNNGACQYSNAPNGWYCGFDFDSANFKPYICQAGTCIKNH